MIKISHYKIKPTEILSFPMGSIDKPNDHLVNKEARSKNEGLGDSVELDAIVLQLRKDKFVND